MITGVALPAVSYTTLMEHEVRCKVEKIDWCCGCHLRRTAHVKKSFILSKGGTEHDNKNPNRRIFR
ncbi:hypothetical protein FJZ31_34175 [Candidatus Poribacteria bacterium]|nr:hypothetical protein [Candidatus Poribacteria bacterium]